MREPDVELEGWRRQWQAHDVPADLRKKVEAGTRSMRLGRAAEVGVTVVMGGGSLGWAVVAQRADVVVLAIAIWIFIAIAWTLSALLHRGAWQPASATTAAFLEISILRCERGLQAITIQALFYAVILAFDLVWLYFYRAESDVTFLTRPAVIVIAWVGTPVLAAVAVWYRRRLLRELRNLLRLRLELGDS
jgi:hypothetical protein